MHGLIIRLVGGYTGVRMLLRVRESASMLRHATLRVRGHYCTVLSLRGEESLVRACMCARTEVP